MGSPGLLTAMPQEQQLTPLEAAVLLRYMTHFNITRAVKEAGYTTINPAAVAYDLMHKPYFVNAIRTRMQETVMGSEEALARLATMARLDITEYYDVDETGQPVVNLQRLKADGMGFCVKSITSNRFGQTNVEFYSALECMNLIARNLGLLKEQPQINLNVALGEWAQFVQHAKNAQKELPPSATSHADTIKSAVAYARAKHELAQQEYEDQATREADTLRLTEQFKNEDVLGAGPRTSGKIEDSNSDPLAKQRQQPDNSDIIDLSDIDTRP